MTEQQAKKKPNEISSDREHMYTIRIPEDMWNKLKHRSRKGTQYRGCVAYYIFSILWPAIYGTEFEIPKPGPMHGYVPERPTNLDDLRQREAVGQVFYVDPPRRYSGFIGGMLRSWRIATWFHRKNQDRKDSLKNV